ncbi:hypothetical protein H0N96_00180 [Candidatus Micrarchaeota archaeon]|nr:hypothetical protein [Candidatus Micrarchaeota archaeon]
MVVMKETLVKTWLKEHPALKEFDPKRAPDSPNPLVLLELIPDSFGEQFLVKPLEKPFEVKPLEIISSHVEQYNQPCRLYDNQIHVTNNAYHHFLRSLGLYAWKYLFTLEERKNYTSIVGAFDSNHLFEKEKKGIVSPTNSTWLHFARNVQNVIAMRPLEFAKHRKGASEALLAFFEEIGVIDERHRKLYLKKLGNKRAFEAKNQSETSEWIEHGHVRRSEALKLLDYVQKKGG